MPALTIQMGQVVPDVTVSVNTAAVTGTMAWAPSAFGVQRFLRANSMTAGERAAAVAVMDDIGVDLMTVMIGGGYQNANTTYQMFNQRDPMDSVGNYTWDSNANIGLDQWFGYLDELIALRPAAKMLVVLYDHPKAILAGDTRASETPMVPWPPAAEFAKYGPLLSALDSRYSGKVWGIGYGQELKGFTSRTDTTALNNFADGFTEVATYVRANLPSWKICYPHLNLWASFSSLANRAAAMDALIAGGDFHADDELGLSTLLSRVDPDHVDYITPDYSIVDYNGTDWRGDYAAVLARITMPFHVVRRLKEIMTAEWATQKPVIAIEAYYDVNQAVAEWATDLQQAALTTAMSLEFARAGGQTEMRWEPQGGDALNVNMASWWTENGVATDLADYHVAFRNALPLGVDLYETTASETGWIALAGGTNAYVLNMTDTAGTVAVSTSAGTTSPVSVGAYGYQVVTLP